MLAIFCDIAWDVRHFNYVVDDKGRQRLHSRELIRLVERQIRAVYAHAFEELIVLGEGFQRRVRVRESIYFCPESDRRNRIFRRI